MSALSRRHFIQTSLLATAAVGMNACSTSRPAKSARTIPISLQLYSVRGDCARDFDAALAQVAAMGFAGVEFAGYYNYEGKPKELRKKLDDLNLKAEGTHLRMTSFKGDALKQTIDFHQAIGCKFLIVPNDKDFADPEKSKTLAETFNQTAAALKPAGLFCGYHNHKGEFEKDEGKTYWDLFAERTTPDVILQQDCGWTATAGLNPAELVRKHPGRTKTTHFKPTVVGDDPAKKPILGQDSVDWAAVLAACREVGGTEWVTLEQEYYLEGKSPMECTAMSFAALKKLMGA